jgi:hypothetical protein
MQSNLTVKIGADIAGLQQELNKAKSSLNQFDKSLDSLKSAVLGAFAGASIASVASFAFEVSKLAGEAQGVKAAFDKLPGSIQLMEDLKKATGGTVSELDLMKRSVQASNFGISLGALPKLLEFATLRAQQTGQSVDYLVDSIITGIGRKSPLILDNLGISAVALKQKLGGISSEAATVGDVADAVGKIATESLGKMAGFAENSSTKIQRLAAEWENLKVAIGNSANSTGMLGAITDHLTASMYALSSSDLGFFEKLALFASGGTGGLEAGALLARARELDKLREAAEKLKSTSVPDVDPVTGLPLNGSSPWEKQIVTLSSLKAKLKELNDTFEVTDSTDQKRLKNLADEINLTEDLIKKIDDLKTVQIGLSQTSQRALKDKGTGKVTTLGHSAASDLLPGGLSTKEFQPQFDALNNAYLKSGEYIKNWAAMAAIAHDEMIAKQQEQASVAIATSDIIASAAEAAFSGQATGVQALENATFSIIQLYYKQAVAAAIAKAIETGGPLPVGLIAAGIGIAAVKGLFSKLGGTSGGGGSASGGSVTGIRGRSSLGYSPTQKIAVMPSGEWKIQGRDLVYAYDKNKALDQKRKS